MESADLETRLRLGEDGRTEFKSVARDGKIDARDLAKAIVALANTRGGSIYVGVEDDGTPTGVGTVQQADALMRQASKVCQDAIHPAITCGLSKVAVRSVTLLVIEVPAFSVDRPYRAGSAYYIRDATRSREAKREELIRLLESAGAHFDEQPVSGATLEELERGSVQKFLAAAYDPSAATEHARYLRALKCVDESGTPTVAGVLFFAKDPGQWLPDARVSAVRFPGRAITSEFADRRELAGRLPDQLEGAIGFLERHVAAPSDVKSDDWKRVERGIPQRVLREAVLNALAHRDYRAASQVRVLVFDDRVEIVNPGGLLNRLDLDSIRIGGISQRRNSVVAALVARTAQRESRRIGVPEMIRLMKARGLPEPEFDLRAGHFRVSLRNAASGPE